MNILFIGGTGNISSACAERLRTQGHKVALLSRGNNPVPEGLESLVADRNDAGSMRDAIGDRRFDAVANFIGFKVPDLRVDLEVLGARTDHYLFISTAMVYAKPHTQLPITESAPLGNEFSDYAQWKLECEEWLKDRADRDGFPVTIVRPSHTYGRTWIPNTVSSKGYTMAARLEEGKPLFVPNDGTNPWTLTATSDFATGFAGLVGNEKAIGETFHITSDEALTWKEIYGELARAVDAVDPDLVEIPVDFICEHFPSQVASLRGDKANPGVFDNAKIKSFVPEFECRKSFREGIRESVNYLREHPEHQNLNPQVDQLVDNIIKAWRLT